MHIGAVRLFCKLQDEIQSPHLAEALQYRLKSILSTMGWGENLSISKHDRLISIQQHALFEMIIHRAG